MGYRDWGYDAQGHRDHTPRPGSPTTDGWNADGWTTDGWTPGSPYADEDDVTGPTGKWTDGIPRQAASRSDGPGASRAQEDRHISWVADLHSDGSAAEAKFDDGDPYGRSRYGQPPPSPRTQLGAPQPVWAYHDPALPGQPRRQPARDRLEPDDGDPGEQANGYLVSMLCTAGWFAFPLVLYTLWILTLDSEPADRCVDAAGEICASARTEALTDLAASLPRVGATLLVSLVVALLLRWASARWRAVTVGFAAAVIGAGSATVLFSVVSGHSLG